MPDEFLMIAAIAVAIAGVLARFARELAPEATDGNFANNRGASIRGPHCTVPLFHANRHAAILYATATFPRAFSYATVTKKIALSKN
jgi:hypothetical protein